MTAREPIFCPSLGPATARAPAERAAASAAAGPGRAEGSLEGRPCHACTVCQSSNHHCRVSHPRLRVSGYRVSGLKRLADRGAATRSDRLVRFRFARPSHAPVMRESSRQYKSDPVITYGSDTVLSKEVPLRVQVLAAFSIAVVPRNHPVPLSTLFEAQRLIRTRLDVFSSVQRHLENRSF